MIPRELHGINEQRFNGREMQSPTRGEWTAYRFVPHLPTNSLEHWVRARDWGELEFGRWWELLRSEDCMCESSLLWVVFPFDVSVGMVSAGWHIQGYVSLVLPSPTFPLLGEDDSWVVIMPGNTVSPQIHRDVI